MDHTKKSTYLFSIDALRVIAILAVIMIHVSTKTLSMQKLNVETGTLTLILNQTSRFAVPLFFLISGFVLELNNKNNLSFVSFFKRRASRIILPFLFWSSLYFLIGRNFDPTTLASSKFFWTAILGTASYHLYFIPTLILFYLAFPILHTQRKILQNPIALSAIFILQGYLLYQDYYIQTWRIQYDLRIALLSFSMFILGMVASHYPSQIYAFVKKYATLLIFFLISLLLFINIHVYDMTLKLKTSRFIYNQFSPLNYLYTVVVASTLFYILEKTQFMKKWFMTLSKLSLFVFFIHVLIQNIVWDNILMHVVAKNGIHFLTYPWFDLTVFLTISLISFTIAYLVHKIPYASKITG